MCIIYAIEYVVASSSGTICFFFLCFQILIYKWSHLRWTFGMPVCILEYQDLVKGVGNINSQDQSIVYSDWPFPEHFYLWLCIDAMHNCVVSTENHWVNSIKNRQRKKIKSIDIVCLFVWLYDESLIDTRATLNEKNKTFFLAPSNNFYANFTNWFCFFSFFFSLSLFGRQYVKTNDLKVLGIQWNAYTKTHDNSFFKCWCPTRNKYKKKHVQFR